MKTLYKTIIVSNTDKFDREINSHLEEGWELYGNSYTTGWRRITEGTSSYWTIDYCQALIKKI